MAVLCYHNRMDFRNSYMRRCTMMKKLLLGIAVCGLFHGKGLSMECVELKTQAHEAFNKWMYLVKEKDQVNALLTEAIIRIYSEEKQRELTMDALVQFVCSPEIGKEYAHYVNNVFSSMNFLDHTTDVHLKYRRMFASIDSDRSGGGGTCADLYLKDYASGFYNSYVPDDQDVWKWKSFSSLDQEESDY